jgi:hypothetical protein
MQFTVWWLMVLVAVAGVATWAEMMRRRSRDFRQMANTCKWREFIYRSLAEEGIQRSADFERGLLDVEREQKRWMVGASKRLLDGHSAVMSQARARLLDEDRQQWRRAREIADYWARLRRKYERASSHPWLPVEPDQPPPPRVFDFPEQETGPAPEDNPEPPPPE